METQNVTKFKVAEVQLISAIEMYFRNENPVAVHTLVGASHEILDILCEHNGYERGAIQHGLSTMVSSEHKDRIYKKIFEARNFFKHGGKDPDKVITWNPKINDSLILDTISLYKRLSNNKMPSEIMVAFVILRALHSDLWADNSALGPQFLELQKMVNEENKSDVYQMLTS